MFPAYQQIQKAQIKQNEEKMTKARVGRKLAALYRGAATRQNPTIYLKKLERTLTLLTDIKEKFISNADIDYAIRNSHPLHFFEPDPFPMPPPARRSKRESVFVPPHHPARIERKEGDEGYLVKMLQKKLRLQFKANLEEILNDIAKISSLNLNVAAGVFRRRSDRLGVEKERGRSMVPIQEKQIMLHDEGKPRLIFTLCTTLSGHPRILDIDGTVRLSVLDRLEKMKYMYTSEDALKEPARFIDFLIDFLNNEIRNFKHRFMSNPERRKVSFKKVAQRGRRRGGRRRTRKKKKRKKRKTRKKRSRR
jgi:hypothetical protein